MTPTNGIVLYNDERVLIALGRLLEGGRDQAIYPITQADISEAAFVSLRTVHDCLDRLIAAGLLIANNRKPGRRPATYSLSERALAIVEEHHANVPDCK